MKPQPAEFGAPDNAVLTGLIFELASQLHVERTRRQALEAALVAHGLIGTDDLETASRDPSFRVENGAALDDAIRKLLKILTESDDLRTPLRGEGAPMKKVP
jgi:hypothetical protein